MAKRNTLENPKTKRLARALGVVPGVALGLLETIWHWTADFRKHGGLTVNDFEDALDSGGWLIMFSTRQVLDAMTSTEKECVWLDPLTDGRYYVHDWHDHCEDSINRALARDFLRFANGKLPNLSKLTKEERVPIEKHFADEEKALCAQRAPSGGPASAIAIAIAQPEPLPASAHRAPNSAQGAPKDPHGTRDQACSPWEEFLAVYPKRDGPLNAETAEPIFRRHVRTGIPAQTIIDGARRYRDWAIATKRAGTELVAMITTWLNRKGWMEAYEIPPDPKDPANQVDPDRKKPVENTDYWLAPSVEGDPNSDVGAFAIVDGKKTRQPFDEQAWRRGRRLNQ
jgi:hypothetical protein